MLGLTVRVSDVFAALTKVCEKANSVCTTDIEAPSWIHKYIIGRKGANIKEITQHLPTVHIEFTDKQDRIKIEGPTEEVEKAREQIESKTRELVGKLVFVEINVDPRFYKHIIGKNGSNGEIQRHIWIRVEVIYCSLASAGTLFSYRLDNLKVARFVANQLIVFILF